MHPADQLLHALEGAGRVLLTGPVETDGDSIGACLALQRVLGERGLEVDVVGDVSYRYVGLPGVEAMLRDDDLSLAYDAVVVLDGDRHRLAPRTDVAFAAARVKAIVDHHASTRSDGYTVAWVEGGATSTCEMLYAGLLKRRGITLDADLAALLYVGAIYDTGGFRYSNTTPATHAMAADLLALGIDHADLSTRILMERRESGLRLAGEVFAAAELHVGGRLALGIVPLELAQRVGAVPGDIEGIVDALVHTRGVEVAVLLVERRPDLTKASLRSRGLIDVSRVAQSLSTAGGGHTKAAGASLLGTLDAARERVRDVLAAAIEAAA